MASVLLISYINDLPDMVRNMAILFTDDTKVYAFISNEEGHRGLQKYFENLVS